ncbi:hypothetical protein C0Q70_07165 [Pomacea canaliculata]|uniref:ADP-ribosyl cyclase/cyclic ADP-ribose hydrolase n=1 Tax=Pomacea canaliculata TaxID=400727 RepID=A0A2T7PEB2_POMCA|nr:hypothetical protein C0Q70_07165 [Pomacea canaliculata]
MEQTTRNKNSADLSSDSNNKESTAVELSKTFERSLSDYSSNNSNNKAGSMFDPSKTFERSLSDATLLSLPLCALESTFKLQHGRAASVDNTQDNTRLLPTSPVSERSTVYENLSSAESVEAMPLENRAKYLRFRERHVDLETIHQDDQEVEAVHHDVVFQDKHFANNIGDVDGEMLSIEPLSPEDCEGSRDASFYTKYPLRFPHGYSLGKYRHNLKLSYQTLSQRLEGFIKNLQEADPAIQCRILTDILLLIKEAWDTPVYGRDLAYGLCDIMRMEGLVDMLIRNCDQQDSHDLLLHSANLLEQVINLGGLDVILRWCRCGTDYHILRRCAKALANLSLFGGAENQEVMAKHKVPEWLFPLAFSDDNSVRYYACMAISALVANKELEASVIKSGTLDLVLPFINSTRPINFAQSDVTHKQGRDKIWLKHLIPLLFSRRQEAQALAAFHFAMEAIIKAEQGRQDIFHEIDAVEPLKKIASSPNTVASKLAAEALKVIGEKIPHKLSQQVPLWTVEDVAHWVSQIGFPDYVESFKNSQVDGDLLLILTAEDLSSGLGMISSIVRKRFMRELKSLKITADYSASDPSGLDKWLMELCPELSQYTYYMLRQGVDKFVLKTLTDQELREECGICNSIHRRKILQGIQEVNGDVSVSTPAMMPHNLPSLDFTTSLNINPTGIRTIDVFICYRRSSGSQLASLLKVHLQLRGFSVFLDIDRLRAGKFDENLLFSIQMSQHFLIILTHDALDRCLDDIGQEDWVHKEVIAALESNCNIVPIFDNFEWPPLERLPEDMRGIVRFNSVRWVHEYQDACVDKLETFLRRGRRRLSQQSPGHQSSSHLLGSDSHLSELSLRSQVSYSSSQGGLDVFSQSC